MQELSKMADAYSKATVGPERIHEVLDTPREVMDLPGARRTPRFRGQVAYEAGPSCAISAGASKPAKSRL